MRVAVIGSRTWTDLKKIYDTLDDLKDIKTIISGGARSADQISEEYAKDRNLRTMIFFPDYDRYGKIAPLIRNREIVKNADMVIAFHDGKSRGTLYTIDYAKKLGIPCRVIA